MRGVRFFPDNMNFDFLRYRMIGMVVFFVFVFGTIGLLFTKGLNFGIDFTGGMLIEIRMDPAPDLGQLREGLNSLDLGDVSIQEFGIPGDVLIRVPEQGEDVESQRGAEQAVRDYLDGLNAESLEYRRVEFVGPQVGGELIRSGFLAILFSILGILAYVTFRFEWQYGVASVLALLHDVLAIIGYFALTQKQFDLATVAAVLTIAGYSINDTVVIFDRIRENSRKFKKMPLYDLINKSLNETLSRTILTSVTTILALASLWMFGGEVIRSFVEALLIGVVIGIYSTIFVAVPKLLWLGIKRSGD